MSTDEQYADLGRLVFQTAGALRLSAERMQALGVQPDGYTPHELAAAADALHGMAIRCAKHAGDTTLLADLTGRGMHEIPADTVLPPTAPTWRATTDFTNELTRHCAEVRTVHNGAIPAHWPRVWQLVTSFTMRNRRHLEALAATPTDVALAVAAHLGIDRDNAIVLLHIAATKTEYAATPQDPAEAPTTVCLQTELEFERARWELATGGADPDVTLPDDIAGLIEVTLPSTERIVLSWAAATVRAGQSSRVPESPAHEVITVLIDIRVAESLWRAAAGSCVGDLAEDIRAYIHQRVVGIAQFDDASARIVTTIIS